MDKIKYIEDIEKREQRKIDSLNELNESIKELRKINKRKLKIFLGIILFIIVIIKVFIGTIEIENPFGYREDYIRFYKVTINDQITNTHNIVKHTIPIIPFLVNFNSYMMGGSYAFVELNNHGAFEIKQYDNVYIDMEVYSCYSTLEKFRLACQNIKQEMIKENDEVFKKMIITRTNKPYEEVYNGKYINDISKYVKNKGHYCIQIITKRPFVETEVYFYLGR